MAPHPLRRAIAVGLGALAIGALAPACSTTADDGRPQVVAAFYPLQFLAERIGGDHISVTNLTRPGLEPHDLELRPRDVGSVVSADLVLYLDGFQPSVDAAVGEAGDAAFDVSTAADPVPYQDHASIAAHSEGEDHDHDVAEGDEHDHAADAEGAEHADAHDHDGHDHGSVDPHFWLDPERMEHVAEAVRDRLVDLDPDNAAAYRANTAKLIDDLAALDDRFSTGLVECRSREVVTTHAAFGYLADRYDLHQLGITGLSPTEEPTASQLASATAFVKDHDVTTIFFEQLVSPAVTRTVAAETGAKTDVLDPLEGIVSTSAGTDYLSVMDANLASLRGGLGCS